MGRFIREELLRAGVDVSHVHTDKNRLTALVVLGIKSREEFPLIFFRRDCADMALCEADFDEAFIASSKSLVLTGTHLSTDSTYRASTKAADYARANRTKVVLDIDYRPVLWGLTGVGEGENRYVEHAGVTARLQTLFARCDLIVGTEEEINIAGGHSDLIASLKAVRAISNAAIVLKLGALGCAVLPGDIPDSMAHIEPFRGVEVEVLNVLGAGDAFMSGFLRGWINGESWERCCAYANACGALVVSRHGCAPAIPSQRELEDYLARAERVPPAGQGRAPELSAPDCRPQPGVLARAVCAGLRPPQSVSRHGPAGRRRCGSHRGLETAYRRSPVRGSGHGYRGANRPVAR